MEQAQAAQEEMIKQIKTFVEGTDKSRLFDSSKIVNSC